MPTLHWLRFTVVGMVCGFMPLPAAMAQTTQPAPRQLAIIKYASATDDALVDAIAWCRRHAEVLMTAESLRDVIDDTSFTGTHRRRCFVQAWSLHVKTPTTFHRLFEIFGEAKWANAQTVEVLGFATGKLPVAVNLDDTIFVVTPRFGADDPMELFIRVRGQMTVDEFLSAFQTDAGPVHRREILETGFGNLDSADKLLTQSAR